MTDIARLGMDVDSSGLRDGQRELRNLVGEGAKAEGAVERQSKRTSASWGRMAAKAGLAVAAIGTGITLAVRGQLNEIDKLAKSAQQIGIPVEHLSQMQHAAELSGVSMAELETGLRRLSQNMVQDADKFAALGIAVRDANGEMRPTIDVMDDLADVMAAMPDGAEKTALAMDLMGRSGANLIPMFNDGADAIRQMRDEADRLGLTISQDTAEAAQNFNDNITRLTGAGRGFWRMISAELAPTLEKFSGIVVDLVNKFGEMSPRMRGILSNGALMLAVMAPLVAVVGAFAGAVALIGGPALAVAAGIAAITAAAIAFWPEIKAAGQAVYDFAESIGAIDAIKIFFEGVMEQGRNFIELFRAIFTADLPAIMNSLVAIFEQPMKTITALWESDFAEPLREMVTGIGTHIRETFNSVMEWFGELPERFLEFGRNMVQGLLNGFNEMWEAFKENIREKVDWIPDWVKRRLGIHSPSRVFHEIGENIGQGLAGGIESTFGMVRSAVEGLTNATTSSAFDMANEVVGAMGQMFQGSKPIAAAQALINTFQGVTEALKLGPWGIAKAAVIAAMGMKQVKGILSARPGSSGGASSSGRSASSGGEQQAQQQQAPTTTFQFTLQNDSLGFGENFARQMVEQLNEAQRNGGQVRGVLA